MAGEWPEAPLGELVQNFDSRRIPLSSREREKRRGQYPYYGATGVMDRVDDFLFEGLHLLVAEDGSVERPDGKPFLQLVDGRFWVNNHAHVLKGSTDEDTRFLFYALSTVAIRPYMSGSVQAKLSQGNLNRIPTPYPADETDRRAIAHILGTLDDKIELNRRMSETLEAMARALFKSWFVDFDPVRAKAEGRDPGLPQPLADLFPARLVDSELGEIPEGWEVGTFGVIVDQLRDNENPLSIPASRFLHFSIPAFDDGRWPKLELGEDIKSQKSRVPPGVVLLSKLNPEIERVWLVDVKRDDRAVCSTEFLVLRPRPPYGRSYVYCAARSPSFRQEIEGLVTGTSKSHQRAQAGAILGLTAIKPPDALATAFEQAAAPLLDRTLECRRESRTLAALRDALLPKLISGELRVKHAERLVVEAR
jgi:type I restriction enzyme S subunit